MEINESLKNEVAVLSLNGKMMGGDDTQEVHEHVKQLIGRGIHHVVIDMAELQWLNSSGMGVLIACYTSAKSAGGDMVLAKVSGKTLSLLQMMHLNLVFQRFESVDKAVKSFPSPKHA